MQKTYVSLPVLFIGFFFVGNVFAQSLTLDPNHCFFSPKGTLKLLGETAVVDDYNKNKHYEQIAGWEVQTDSIVWGLKDVQEGILNVELFAGISSLEDEGTVAIYVGDQVQILEVNATGSINTFLSQGVVSFEISQPGNYEVKIKIEEQNSNSDFGSIEKLELSGSALTGASVWKRRWRPAAIHAPFISDNSNQTEITVYEMDILTQDLWSYQVMSTEFGYVGSPSSPFTGLSGFNFSLWSFGANDEEPAHEEMSHLISVGGDDAYFGRYGHEGTGVKPRGHNPYEGDNYFTYTVAVRKEGGAFYNTYWSYYLDPVTQHWKLFGCGKKFNESGVAGYMNQTSSFVEVVGPPNNSRTGHRARTVEFRGWRMQADGTWNPLHSMDPVYNTATAISNKVWSTNDTGDRFVLTCGGLADSPADPGIVLLDNPSDLPSFLQGAYLDELYEMPASFETKDVELLGDGLVRLNFDVYDLGTNPSARLYYGREFALTEGIWADALIDEYWENYVDVDLSQIDQDILSVDLVSIDSETTYYYRLRIENEEGITWSFDTESFLSLNTGTINLLQSNLISYPNPCEGVFMIQDYYQGEHLEIFDSRAQAVSFQVNALGEVELESVSKGVYYVCLLDRKIIGKVIVQ